MALIRVKPRTSVRATRKKLSLFVLVMNLESLVLEPVLLLPRETQGIKQMRKKRTKEKGRLFEPPNTSVYDVLLNISVM